MQKLYAKTEKREEEWKDDREEEKKEMKNTRKQIKTKLKKKSMQVLLRGVMCLRCCVVSYWICQAVWRQAGRPQWGEGCRPQGHSGRKARPGRRDLPGTPHPQCFQTPGVTTHAGISHPLAAIKPVRRWETMVQLWRHSNALKHYHLTVMYIVGCIVCVIAKTL